MRGIHWWPLDSLHKGEQCRWKCFHRMTSSRLVVLHCWVFLDFGITQPAQIPCLYFISTECVYPDSKVHWAYMGPTWVLSSPGGPHVGPMNLAIRDTIWSVLMMQRWVIRGNYLHESAKLNNISTTKQSASKPTPFREMSCRWYTADYIM